MKNSTYDNSVTWEKIYKNTGFGNKYPSSYFVSLLYRYILPLIRKGGRDDTYKALDFGCSHGANAKVLNSAGFDVYGIDISQTAIDYCISKEGFDPNKFVAGDIFTGNPFMVEKFDLIIASEVLYYFGKSDLKRLYEVFSGLLKDDGLIYVCYPSFNTDAYRPYKDFPKNEDSTIRVERTGSVLDALYVMIPESKEELRQWIPDEFKTVKMLREIQEFETENESFHFIGKKQ